MGRGSVETEPQDIIDGGVAVQTRQTLENIRTALQTAGATMKDVAECTVFLVDMADYAAMNGVYLEFFPVDPPARATVAVAALPRPAARVEIKCSARIGSDPPRNLGAPQGEYGPSTARMTCGPGRWGHGHSW